MENEIRLENIIDIISDKLARGADVTINPKGQSMMPLIHQGRDSVVLKKPPEILKKYDIVLYRRDNGQFVLHRVIGMGNDYIMCGDNQWQREKNIKHEQICAVATAVIRKGKRIETNCISMKLYSRCWVLLQSINGICHAVWRKIKKLGG